MSWEAVIGLEVHAQLATRTKIFCGCPNTAGGAPNTRICPVCTGQPGALPVLNREAVDLAIRAALALSCEIRPRSVFARKQYFYPDLPKGYQISQYELPYAEHGRLRIELDGDAREIGITRIHMEEDAGKSSHAAAGNASVVDLNRAGSPLVEIVSEPELRSAAEAGAYLRELHAILRTAGISDADMEKGNFRCDANVSVRRSGETRLGTKAELKNINSFRFVERAIEYEIERQIAELESGGSIRQETRLWDTQQQRTVAMRGKEEAHDYRYFPDPDLPPLVLETAQIEAQRRALPPLPAARRARYAGELGLTVADAVQLAADPDLADYFEDLLGAGVEARLAANWTLNEVLRFAEAGIALFPVRPDRLAGLLRLLAAGEIPGNVARKVFGHMRESDEDAPAIIAREGLQAVADSDELGGIIEGILAAHPDEVQRYRAGDHKLFGYFMGQLMKATRGKADPDAARQLLEARLAG